MKAFMVFCLIVCMIGGCTTLQPVANVPSDLSEHYNDGGVPKPGDRVVIATTAGAKHQFRVSSVRDGVIYGDHDSVPLSEISVVQRRELSSTKTTVLVVVIAGVVAAIASGIHSAEHPNVGLQVSLFNTKSVRLRSSVTNHYAVFQEFAIDDKSPFDT
jgi:hypothetical protein